MDIQQISNQSSNEMIYSTSANLKNSETQKNIVLSSLNTALEMQEDTVSRLLDCLA